MRRDFSLMRDVARAFLDGAPRDLSQMAPRMQAHAMLLADAGMLTAGMGGYCLSPRGIWFAMAHGAAWHAALVGTVQNDGLPFDMFCDFLAREMGQSSAPADDDAALSQIQVNDKTVVLIAVCLASKCHDLALARGVTGHSVQNHLPLILDVIADDSHNLIRLVPVVATVASDIAAFRLSFDPEGYRRAAQAAKDRMANAVY